MNILVFSDTHLFNFDERKYEFLKKIITKSDRVIINGDFYEGWLLSFDQFVKSPWKQLFPLLKDKKAVYVFGNHDREEWSNEKVSLFSEKQVSKYEMRVNGKTFVFQHGHTFDLSFHNFIGKKGLLYKFDHSRFGYEVFMQSEALLSIPFGKKVFQKRFQRFNEEIKQQMKDKYVNGEILICGHTHSAEVDLKNNFVNDGYVRNGLGQYVVINSKGQIDLKEELY